MSYWEFTIKNLPPSEKDIAFRHIYSEIANMDIHLCQKQSPLLKVKSQVFPKLDVHKVIISSQNSQKMHSRTAKRSSELMSLMIPIQGRVNFTLDKNMIINCSPGDGLLLPNNSAYEVLIKENFSSAQITVPIDIISSRIK